MVMPRIDLWCLRMLCSFWLMCERIMFELGYGCNERQHPLRDAVVAQEAVE